MAMVPSSMSGAGGALASAGSGAASGAAFGPWGAAIGAGVGMLGGMLGGKGMELPTLPTFQSFRTPQGALTQELGTIKYAPKLNSTQKKTQKKTDKGILSAINSLPKSFNVNDFYNNPFYQNSLSLLNNPLNIQRQAEQKELSNRMNAGNQLGSAFDAYQQNLFNQRYDNQYRQNEAQAREVSAQAYQQQFQNALAQLGALRQDRMGALESSYMPLSYGMNAFNILNSSGMQGAQMQQNANFQQQAMQNQNFSTLMQLLPQLSKFGVS